MEEIVKREKYVRFIERLYCKCGKKDKLYASYRKHIVAKKFAANIGGEYYSGNEDFNKLDKNLAELGLDEYLPGGKRQLVIQGTLGEILLKELYPNTPLASLEIDGLEYEPPARTDIGDLPANMVNDVIDSLHGSGRYYVCKSCCSICKFHTHGCTIHCRDNFCDYVGKMALIDITGYTRRNSKPKDRVMKEFRKYLDEKIRLLPGINATRSKGYIRSYFDIAEFIYVRYEIGFDAVYNLIEPLLSRVP
jgi:hypothetical protein